MVAQLVRLQLLDGLPDGLRSAAIAGRTTTLAAVPFQELQRLLERPEANRVAVYAMVGISLPEDATAVGVETAGRPVIYIGQTGSLRQRFAAHHKLDTADWGIPLVANTSCGVFNAAHALRVERLLTERVKTAGRYQTLNQSESVYLDEGDAAFAAAFVEDIVLLAQTLGVEAFKTFAQPSRWPPQGSAVDGKGEAQSDFDEQDFIFRYTNTQVSARMRVTGTRFTVLKGSQAMLRPDIKVAYAAQIREEAVQAGALSMAATNGFLTVERDFEVNSTSAAGALIYGSACAGPRAWWIDGTHQDYGSWLKARAEKSAQTGNVDLLAVNVP